MIPMLLVVGSLVPASDSAELTTAPPESRAIGASLDVRDLIRPGMTTDEMRRLLRTNSLVDLVRIQDVEWWRYERLGIKVECQRGRVTEVIRFKPKKYPHVPRRAHMIPMLLVFGSLVPANDSPELTSDRPSSIAAGATVDVRTLIRRGMDLDELRKLLGEPDSEFGFTGGSMLFYHRFGGELRVDWSICRGVTGVDFRANPRRK
jgi:hypothetical protein